MDHARRFKQRLLQHEPLLGSFVKTPSVHPVEVLGGAGFDFVVIDEEHAPFDRATVDLDLCTRGPQTGLPLRLGCR
jgi:2-keto-3-deoxy-L-rhamnonate aldolase RhmA